MSKIQSDMILQEAGEIFQLKDEVKRLKAELEQARAMQDSCLVCGNIFDSHRIPVIECRGVRVCQVCRSRCSNDAINFQKHTEEKLQTTEMELRTTTEWAKEQSQKTIDAYKTLEQAQRERDALRDSLFQIGNRIGKPTGACGKEYQYLDMEETLQVISKIVQKALAALEKKL